MTTSNIGKVFIGMVLLVGSARAGQWKFAHESTLVPAGPDEAMLGIQSLRVHSPVGSGAAFGARTMVRIEILNMDQQVVGHLIDTKSAAGVRERGHAPEEIIELSFQGRTVNVHYKDRAISLSDGAVSASASFDRTNVEDVERVRVFADDLRLIAGIQIASRAAIDRAASAAPTTQASVMGTFGWERVARVIPASWTSVLARLGGAPAKFDDVACHTEPSHAKCAGGFGASRASGCAQAQQEANNECAEASGWCVGCCAWIGSGCDCACIIGDLGCMCESCGGLCGPSSTPQPKPAPDAARAK